MRRDFDGARFIDHWGGAIINFLSSIRLETEGVSDDHIIENHLLWSAYPTVPLGPVLKADIHELNCQNNAAKYLDLVSLKKRQACGIQLFGEAEGFD